MASGGAGCQVEIRLLRPELLSSRDLERDQRTERRLENLDDRQMLEHILVSQNIDAMSPLSMGGEGTAYFFDEMQVETCATPMGMGMAEGDIVALWNSSKLPQCWQGKKNKKNRDKLKEKIIKLTGFVNLTLGGDDRWSEGISRGLYPVMSDTDDEGDCGLKWPPDMISHGPTCKSKEEVYKLLLRVSESQSKLHVTAEEWKTARMFVHAEMDLGYSATFEHEDESGQVTFLHEMWVTGPPDNDDVLAEYIQKVVFTLNVDINGGNVHLQLPYIVTDLPYRHKEPLVCPFLSGGNCASKVTITIEVFIGEAGPGHDGVWKVKHDLTDSVLQFNARKSMKWNTKRDLAIPAGDANFNHQIKKRVKIVEKPQLPRFKMGFCLPGLTTTDINMGYNGRNLENVCEVINQLLIWSNRCQLEGPHQALLNLPPDEESPCRDVDNLFKYCAGFNDTCITDLMWSNVSTCRSLKGAWLKWTIYIGPVRNGTPSEVRSLLPIVRLAPNVATGTVDNLVQMWKSYIATEGYSYRFPEGPSHVTYNEDKIEIGRNIKVMDIVDRSVSNHYFAIPMPGCDSRNINQLLEFIEGKETGEHKKKKGKGRKKQNPEDTPVDLSPYRPRIQAVTEKIQMDRKKCQRRAKLKHGDKEIESNILETDQGSMEEDVANIRHDEEEQENIPHGLDLSGTGDPNIQALRKELVIKEAKLKELLESGQVLVESRGKEMSVLLSRVEDAEEEKHSMLKQVAELDNEMQKIKDELAKMDERKGKLMKNMKGKDKKLNKSLKKKKQLEDLIEAEVNENKQARRELEKEIASLKAEIEALTKSKANPSNSVDKAKLENQRFLLNINKKIEAKESDLECPVCFEVSTTPIYSCNEQHIICSDCRPKVSIRLKSITNFPPHILRFRSQSVPSAEKLTQANHEDIAMRRKQLKN